MNREELKKLSIITIIISAGLFIFNYFFFHFVTDEGIVFVKQEEAGKPFVTNLIGMLATLFLFTSCLSFILYLIKKEDK